MSEVEQGYVKRTPHCRSIESGTIVQLTGGNHEIEVKTNRPVVGLAVAVAAVAVMAIAVALGRKARQS